METGPVDDTPPLDGIVCDLDGVVYLGDEAVPGAGEALARIRAEGIDVVFVTNNSSRSPETVAERIRTMTGFPAEPENVLTSAMAAGLVLRGSTQPAFVLGGDGIRRALSDEGITVTDRGVEAGAVVVGLDRALTYDRLKEATIAVRRGARFVATNHDPTFPTESGLWPGAGSIVAAVERAADVAPEIAGKPFAPMRRLVRERIGSDRIWVIGDRIDTDLAMAAEERWAGVLVLTGVTETAPSGDPRVDRVVESIADVPELLGL